MKTERTTVEIDRYRDDEGRPVCRPPDPAADWACPLLACPECPGGVKWHGPGYAYYPPITGCRVWPALSERERLVAAVDEANNECNAGVKVWDAAVAALNAYDAAHPKEKRCWLPKDERCPGWGLDACPPCKWKHAGEGPR